MWTSKSSAMIKVLVESLEDVYYRKEELLYILIAFSFFHLFRGFDLLISVCRRPCFMLLIPKTLKDATFRWPGSYFDSL